MIYNYIGVSQIGGVSGPNFFSFQPNPEFWKFRAFLTRWRFIIINWIDNRSENCGILSAKKEDGRNNYALLFFKRVLIRSFSQPTPGRPKLLQIVYMKEILLKPTFASIANTLWKKFQPIPSLCPKQSCRLRGLKVMF